MSVPPSASVSCCRPTRRELFGLGVLLACLGLLHLVFRGLQPEPRVWGDETHYWAFATQEAFEGRTGFLPGTFGFDHRPQLATRVFAQFADSRGIPAQPQEMVASAAKLVLRVGLFQIPLLLLALTAVYATARTLGLSSRGGLASVLFLGLLPQVGFHVHSLWPELLHLCLASLGLLGLIFYLQAKRLYALALAGLALGLALFSKGSLQVFLPLIPPALFLSAWRDEKFVAPDASLASRARRGARSAIPALVFLAPLALVLVPQILANARAGHGARLSANRWWNLELGLTLNTEDFKGEGAARFEPLVEKSLAYFAAADQPAERERLARERTLRYVREHLPSVLWDQLEQTLQLFFFSESSLEQSLSFRGRWGATPPAWMNALATFGRGLWFLMLAMALYGLHRAWSRPGWRLLSLFGLSFLAGLFLVSVKFRFLLPIVPVLCLFAGAGVERLFSALGGRKVSDTVLGKSLR
ncbi:MAG: hypothetical protein CMJ89_10810 [Planctomycetes bacterium]|nr:hypothetical protein [Planctomycetota bacterium]